MIVRQEQKALGVLPLLRELFQPGSSLIGCYNQRAMEQTDVRSFQTQPSSLPTWIEEGFQRFCHRYVLGDDPSFRQAVTQGQKPRALVVACADSRVDPALLLDARPGELFVVRNVAALVPPPAESGRLAGVSAALEFAVRVLQVPQVLVIGHSLCGGVRAYLHRREAETGAYLARWLELLSPLEETKAAAADEEDFGRAAVRLSLQRLAAFDFVSERLAGGSLTLLGLYLRLQDPALQLVARLP